MGTFDFVYQNKILQLQEENNKLRNIINEIAGGVGNSADQILSKEEQAKIEKNRQEQAERQKAEEARAKEEKAKRDAEQDRIMDERGAGDPNYIPAAERRKKYQEAHNAWASDRDAKAKARKEAEREADLMGEFKQGRVGYGEPSRIYPQLDNDSKFKPGKKPMPSEFALPKDADLEPPPTLSKVNARTKITGGMKKIDFDKILNK